MRTVLLVLLALGVLCVVAQRNATANATTASPQPQPRGSWTSDRGVLVPVTLGFVLLVVVVGGAVILYLGRPQ